MKKNDLESLYYWQQKLQHCQNEYNNNIAAFYEQEQIYLGTRQIESKNSRQIKGPSRSANNVRNIAFELVESQIDSNIPLPRVDALESDNEELAKKIEDSLKADISKLSFENINDMCERITPIHGMSFFEVLWDTSVSKRNYSGELKVRVIHPKQFIPQAGVNYIQEMDYFFIINSVTKKYITSRYGVSEYELTNKSNGSNQPDELVLEVVCWYKNNDEKVSRFVFCDDIILEDIDNYYARYTQICTACGIKKDPLMDSCPCENDSFTDELLEKDIVNYNNKIIEVDYYIPDVYPFVMRENVPLMCGFGGQSDIDVIKDQQNAIKKLYTKIEDKIIKGGSIIEVPDSMRNRLSITDEELKVVYKRPTDPPINVFTIQPDISKDLMFIKDQIKSAQSTLGINDSYQGKADANATSGYAKRLLIEQASGRLRSKQYNKYKAFKELFELMFKFKLAFTDEPVPFVSQNVNGQKSYLTFNKLDFIRMDELGDYYYSDDFLFSVDAAGGLPNDRSFMYEQTLNLYSVSGFGQVGSYPALVRLWESLESLNFPMSTQIKKGIEEEYKNVIENTRAKEDAQMNKNGGDVNDFR